MYKKEVNTLSKNKIGSEIQQNNRFIVTIDDSELIGIDYESIQMPTIIKQTYLFGLIVRYKPLDFTINVRALNKGLADKCFKILKSDSKIDVNVKMLDSKNNINQSWLMEKCVINQMSFSDLKYDDSNIFNVIINLTPKKVILVKN